MKSETPPATAAGKVVLKLGIMDKKPTPEHEAFVQSKSPWVPAVEGTNQWVQKVGGEKVQA